MSVLKRRSRMVSFRLSEDEYIGLKNLCINEGARSVSDLARDAVSRMILKIPNGSNGDLRHLETALRSLQIRIDSLDLEFRRLSQAVEARRQTHEPGER